MTVVIDLPGPPAPAPLPLERFWALVRVARRRSRGHLARLASELTTELKGLTPDQLIAFDLRLDRLVGELDREALAAAARELLGSTTEEDLRALAGWLISRGGETFLRVCRSPESLLATCRQGDPPRFDDLIHLAGAVFEEKTGEEPPARP